jgi:hypothetical protein
MSLDGVGREADARATLGKIRGWEYAAMETILVRLYKGLLLTLLAGAIAATAIFLVTGLNPAYAVPDVLAGATQGPVGALLPVLAGLVGVVLLVGHLLIVATIRTDLARQRRSLERVESLLARQMRRHD